MVWYESKRFFEVWAALAVDDKPWGPRGEDNYWPINGLISWYNDHYHLVYTTGPTVVVDESMWWHYSKKLPHKMKVGQKPRPIGSKIKTIACGKVQIVVACELVHGERISKTLPFTVEFGAAAAVALHGCQNVGLFGTWCTVIADSDFGNL